VVRLSRFFLLLGLLSLVPIATVWQQVSFEKQRWSRSDVE
jgi:hypothetical protein